MKASFFKNKPEDESSVTHSFLSMLGTTTVEAFQQKCPSSLAPICVYSDCMLIDACKEMVRMKKYQLWIVSPDQPKLPIRLFTLTDVCLICETYEPQSEAAKFESEGVQRVHLKEAIGAGNPGEQQQLHQEQEQQQTQQQQSHKHQHREEVKAQEMQ